jgi:hypothetical protein
MVSCIDIWHLPKAIRDSSLGAGLWGLRFFGILRLFAHKARFCWTNVVNWPWSTPTVYTCHLVGRKAF